MNTKQALILSLETSGTTCSVALSEGERLIGEYSIYALNLHDKLNAEFVRRILADTDYSVEDIDAVAVSAGPGSFTGLRIGGSIAKGICFENKPKLISVPTMEAFAFAAKNFLQLFNSNEIVCIINSHKDLLYYCTFDQDAQPIEEIQITNIDEFKLTIKEGILYCGPGALIAGQQAIKEITQLNSGVIARYAFELFKEGCFINAEDYQPVYVQDFKPKTKRKKLNI